LRRLRRRKTPQLTIFEMNSILSTGEEIRVLCLGGPQSKRGDIIQL